MRTFTAKPSEVTRKWHLIDATDVVLGRLSVATATLLRGKNKVTYQPNVDGGDFVIITNAEKISLSGNKLNDKRLYRHSGYLGGLSSKTYKELLKEDPKRIIEHAVKGMLPNNKLAKVQLARLKVFAGPEHTHNAGQPVKYEIKQVEQG
ncbi:MAG: 50S ribosomal protein L13 [Bifidobacteriaceae bacterium]|jgi:large subunit ribosomal protein L13|nr:50S ribosomal protein L13 [Bifidobacteriaceae bacterium]